MPSYNLEAGLKPYDLPDGSEIFRIHWQDKGPIWFGPPPGLPPSYRFDAPGGQYRTLYGAQSVTGAFVETVLRRNGRLISRADVEGRMWTVLRTRRPLRLAKVFDDGLLWHGVDDAITGGDSYADSRQFALDIHSAFSEADGLAYRSKHNNGELCYAIFDRVKDDELEVIRQHRFREERSLTESLLGQHGAKWDPAVSFPPLP